MSSFKARKRHSADAKLMEITSRQSSKVQRKGMVIADISKDDSKNRRDQIKISPMAKSIKNINKSILVNLINVNRDKDVRIIHSNLIECAEIKKMEYSLDEMEAISKKMFEFQESRKLINNAKQVSKQFLLIGTGGMLAQRDKINIFDCLHLFTADNYKVKGMINEREVYQIDSIQGIALVARHSNAQILQLQSTFGWKDGEIVQDFMLYKGKPVKFLMFKKKVKIYSTTFCGLFE